MNPKNESKKDSNKKKNKPKKNDWKIIPKTFIS